MLKSGSLRYNYDQGPELSFPDFTVPRNGHLLIMGRSGSGKTTLLQILAGILPPDEGKVMIDTTSLYGMRKAKRDQFRGQHIGLVFQQSIFIQSLTVSQNLRAAAYFAGNTLSTGKEKEMLRRLDISDKGDRLPQQLSIGEQQRVGIALALVNEPQLILADEPTSALDDLSTEAVYRLLTEEANRLDSALVIVTHDQRLKNKIEQTLTL